MLELGLTFDFGQLVIDHEIAGLNRRVLEGIRCDAGTMGVDVIKEVGIGGHFLRQKHTRAYAAQEQSKVSVIDRRMRGAWEKRGASDVHKRALEQARDILAKHEVAPLPAEAEKVISQIKTRLG